MCKTLCLPKGPECFNGLLYARNTILSNCLSVVVHRCAYAEANVVLGVCYSIAKGTHASSECPASASTLTDCFITLITTPVNHEQWLCWA